MVLYLFKGVVKLPTHRFIFYIKLYKKHQKQPFSSRTKIWRLRHPSRSRPFFDRGIRLQEDSRWVWTLHSKRNYRNNAITLSVNTVESRLATGQKSPYCETVHATKGRSTESKATPVCKCRPLSTSAISHAPTVGVNRTWIH